MPNLGGPEILVILVVALIVLGPQRLPQVGRQIGGALRELRRVQSDVRRELDDALRIDEPPVAAPLDRFETPGAPDGAHGDEPPAPTTSFS